MLLKLITQNPITEGLDYLIEEGNKDKPANMYITGTYMAVSYTHLTLPTIYSV